MKKIFYFYFLKIVYFVQEHYFIFTGVVFLPYFAFMILFDKIYFNIFIIYSIIAFSVWIYFSLYEATHEITVMVMKNR